MSIGDEAMMSIASGTTTPPGDEGTPRLAFWTPCAHIATKPPPLKRKIRIARPRALVSGPLGTRPAALQAEQELLAWARTILGLDDAAEIPSCGPLADRSAGGGGALGNACNKGGHDNPCDDKAYRSQHATPRQATVRATRPLAHALGDLDDTDLLTAGGLTGFAQPPPCLPLKRRKTSHAEA